jgi:hypothetical protein
MVFTNTYFFLIWLKNNYVSNGCFEHMLSAGLAKLTHKINTKLKYHSFFLNKMQYIFIELKLFAEFEIYK